MRSLNYSVPLLTVIPTTVQNISQVVSVLPRTTYEKLILGHFSYLGPITTADVVNTALITQWGFIDYQANLYMETIDVNKAVWRDQGVNNVIGVNWYLSPIYVNRNTQVLLHYSNLKASAATKTQTVFYVARSVVYS